MRREKGGHCTDSGNPLGGCLFIKNKEGFWQGWIANNQYHVLDYLSHLGVVEKTNRLLGWALQILFNHFELT